MLRLDARHLRPGSYEPPVSKSDAIRALVLADMLDLPRPFSAESLPRDVAIVGRAMESLRGARRSEGVAEIDCEDGGAPFRVLLGQAAVTPVPARLTGSARLGERPHRPLTEALCRGLGPEGLALRWGDPWPLQVHGVSGVRATRFVVEASESGQYVTSLLLAAATLLLRDGQPRTIELSGRLASPGYVALTLDWLTTAGFRWVRADQSFTLTEHRRPRQLPATPADWSSAGYLLVLAWLSGGEVIGRGLSAAHPDRRILGLLRGLGLSVSSSAEGNLRVQGQATRGLDVSAVESPDLIPTLAVLAAVLPAVSTFSDLQILRLKESDRVSGLLELLAAAGVTATLDSAHRLVVVPGAPVPPLIRFESRGDHRLAMAAATLACCLGTKLALGGAACVEKSFPRFFEQLALGGAISCYSGAASPATGRTETSK